MGRRILVVEDEAMVREAIKDDLEENGYTVVEASSGDAAWDVIQKGEFDLLFTDIRMPGSIDGWDLAEKAREVLPCLLVVYTSGYTTENRCVESSSFIGKPYRARHVIGVFEEQFEKHEARNGTYDSTH